jgi:hypothetical protein
LEVHMVGDFEPADREGEFTLAHGLKTWAGSPNYLTGLRVLRSDPRVFWPRWATLHTVDMIVDTLRGDVRFARMLLYYLNHGTYEGFEMAKGAPMRATDIERWAWYLTNAGKSGVFIFDACGSRRVLECVEKHAIETDVRIDRVALVSTSRSSDGFSWSTRFIRLEDGWLPPAAQGTRRLGRCLMSVVGEDSTLSGLLGVANALGQDGYEFKLVCGPDVRVGDFLFVGDVEGDLWVHDLVPGDEAVDDRGAKGIDGLPMSTSASQEERKGVARIDGEWVAFPVPDAVIAQFHATKGGSGEGQVLSNVSVPLAIDALDNEWRLACPEGPVPTAVIDLWRWSAVHFRDGERYGCIFHVLWGALVGGKSVDDAKAAVLAARRKLEDAGVGA